MLLVSYFYTDLDGKQGNGYVLMERHKPKTVDEFDIILEDIKKEEKLKNVIPISIQEF